MDQSINNPALTIMKNAKHLIALIGLTTSIYTMPVISNGDSPMPIGPMSVAPREVITVEITSISHAASTVSIPEPLRLSFDVGPKRVYEVWVTAYSSTPDQTDDTPFITASGNRVRDGILAANFLPFGTRVQIPEAFGDKIFIVEDRMHERKKNFVDVWMPTRNDAKQFGITKTQIVVLHSN